MQVIGAGFGRTGTKSLSVALELLGLGPCYHMDELNEHPEHLETWVRALRGEDVDWRRFLADYGAAVDWPSCTFWRELCEAFPEAKIVLTVRDADAWYDSVDRVIRQLTEAGLRHSTGESLRQIRFGNELIFERTFHGRFADRSYAIGVFREHMDEVRRSVPADRLLCFEPSDGWVPLCRLLDRPVPDVPFPHTNQAQFYARKVLDRRPRD